jgi:hypothetical protein
MRIPRRVKAAAIAAGLGVASLGAAGAQERGVRPQSYDFSIGAAHLDGATTPFDGGTAVRTDGATGPGFTFDYHLSDRWSVGAAAAMHSADYVADIAVEGPFPGAPGQRISGTLDSSTLIGHVKRRFGRWERVAPYASAGLGYSTIDTNIPNGPPVGYCWWHAWWGYVCDSVQPTQTTTDLAKQIGVGVRWDFGRRLFLDASVGRQWIDFDNAHRPGFSTLRVAIGFR